MSALPDVVSRDEARYLRKEADAERRQLAAEERLEDWRRNGEVAVRLWEALESHPSAEVLIDKVLFGCSDTRDAAGGALYGILSHYAQRLADRERLIREAGRADALIDEPF